MASSEYKTTQSLPEIFYDIKTKNLEDVDLSVIKVFDEKNVPTIERVKIAELYQPKTSGFLANGKRIIFQANSPIFHIWDLNNGNCEKVLGRSTWPDTAIVLLQNDRIATFGEDFANTVNVWDLHTMECVAELKGHEAPIQFVYSVSEERLLSSDDTHVLKLWDLKSRRCLLTTTDHGIRLDGSIPLLLRMTWPSTKTIEANNFLDVEWLDTNDLHCFKKVRLRNFVSSGSHRISSNGYYAVDCRSAIKVWDLNTGGYVTTLEDECLSDSIRGLAWQKNGILITSVKKLSLKKVQ